MLGRIAEVIVYCFIELSKVESKKVKLLPIERETDT